MAKKELALTDKIVKVDKYIHEKNFAINGVYVSGVWAVSANWKSKIIEVTEGEVVNYRVHSTTNAHLITFIDASNAILSSVLSSTADTAIVQLGSVAAPLGAVKATITTLAVHLEDSWHGKEGDNVHDSIMKALGKTRIVLADFAVDGVYVNNVWTVSANWKSKIIDVAEGEVIDFQVHSYKDAHLITFLDAADGILGWVRSPTVNTEIPQTGSAAAPLGSAKATITTLTAHLEDSWYSGLFHNAELFALKTTEPTAVMPKEIIVDKSLIEDSENYIFNTLSAAVAAANGVDTIKIFGDESTPFAENSLFLPDGVTIIGIGRPWIKGELAASDTVGNIEDKSTIDARESCTLVNLLVTAKNMRYPIHADFSSGNTEKNVKNCSFIHYGNSDAYAYHLANVGDHASITRAMSAWGGGTKAGDRVNIDGCYFESHLRAFSTHNNTGFDSNFGASIVKIANSELKSHGIDRDGSNLGFLSSLHVQHLDSNAGDLIILDNVKMNGYITNQLSGTYISQKVICNTPGLKQIWNKAGSNYSIADEWASLNVSWYASITPEVQAFKNINAGTIARGKAVKLSGIGFDLFTSADPLASFFGILMSDAATGKATDIKFAGYLPWKYFHGTNSAIAEGADISVDASGNFVANSSHVVCKAVDNNNVQIS